jgi:large subunit ribosomal protein L6
MSRVANKPVVVPNGITINIQPTVVEVKGPKGALTTALTEQVKLEQKGSELVLAYNHEDIAANRFAGTVRANLANMIEGVSKGFERKLTLVGVGYRAKAQGSTLNLTLGFSHPIDHTLPKGITVETPSQTEIVLKGADKSLLGQVAADIRNYRPPEPYKGKGIRYSDEVIKIKETKKK